jgi:hypothetical protein
MKVLCIESERQTPTFWVSCNVVEAKQVLDSHEFDEKSRKAFEARIDDLEYNKEFDPLFVFREKQLDPFMDYIGFLVSENLEPIEFYPAHYPVASMWNGYNPFRFFEPIEITSLNELMTLSSLPQVVKALGRD